jgi:hypothetical protein
MPRLVTGHDATCNIHHTRCNIQHATCRMDLTTCRLALTRRAACGTQHAACNIQHALNPGSVDSYGTTGDYLDSFDSNPQGDPALYAKVSPPTTRAHARTHARTRSHARALTHSHSTHTRTHTDAGGGLACVGARALRHARRRHNRRHRHHMGQVRTPCYSCVAVHVHSYAVRSGRGPASALACVHGIAHGLISWIHGMVSHTGWCSRLLVASAATCAFPAWMTATCTSSSARQSLQRYTLPVDHYLLSALSSAMPR